jgi:phospholipase C
MAALSLLHFFSPMTIRSYLAPVAIAFAAGAAPLRAQVPQYDHVVVVIFENHSYSEIIGNPAAPTFNSLAVDGANIVPAANDPTGSRSGSHGLRHPSQPNYLELYSGDNQGVIQDGRPGDPTAEPFSSPPPFKTPNLGASLRTAGYTFATYSESLPSVGYDGDVYTTVPGQNQYQRKHNPVANWVNNVNPTAIQLPSSVNRPFTDFQNMARVTNGFANVPTVSFVVPNEQNDMHDGTIAQADTWLKNNIVNTYLPWARSHNSLLIVTFDEDDDEAAQPTVVSNLIPTIFAGALVKSGNYTEADLNAGNPYLVATGPGVQTPTGTAMNHWNVLSTLEAMYGLPQIGGSSNRPPIIDIFSSPHKLPNPAKSGIEHIIVVMMENRSFDHFLGWLPKANGRQSGLRYSDSQGHRHSTFSLTDSDSLGNFQGCGLQDPDHSFEGGRVEFDNGKCDGWRLNGANSSDDFSIGYYTSGALDFLGHAALDWTGCDGYFSGIMAETYPNRFHMHAAATDRLHNFMHPSDSGSDAPAPSTLPTIWDRLTERGLSGRYYYGDTPFLALWGAKYLNISFPFPQFLADAAAGKLPQVAFIDPRFQDESSGTSNDDHPHADIRSGEDFLNRVYNAVVTSPNWSSTVLIINYDEWGGFFDHVPPPVAPVPNATRTAGVAEGKNVNDPYFGLLGFRTPNLIVSPFATRGYVSHERFDHTSILKMIEWRFGLRPLTVRDQTANNLADALNFKLKNVSHPAYSVPTVISAPCPPVSTGASPEDEWTNLRQYAGSLGFPLP